MAHPRAARDELRKTYAAGTPLNLACERHGIPEATARAWKQRDAGTEQDWDRQRAAQQLAAGGHVEIVQRIVGDFLEAHAETLLQVKSSDMPAVERVECLSRLSDALTKTMAALGKAAPKLSELGIAMEVLTAMTTFARAHHPKLAASLLEILEPFGRELVKKYG